MRSEVAGLNALKNINKPEIDCIKNANVTQFAMKQRNEADSSP
jgi:hypothetical protein